MIKSGHSFHKRIILKSKIALSFISSPIPAFPFCSPYFAHSFQLKGQVSWEEGQPCFSSSFLNTRETQHNLSQKRCSPCLPGAPGRHAAILGCGWFVTGEGGCGEPLCCHRLCLEVECSLLHVLHGGNTSSLPGAVLFLGVDRSCQDQRGSNEAGVSSFVLRVSERGKTDGDFEVKGRNKLFL